MILSCIVVESNQLVVMIAAILKFMWSIDSRAPNRLLSCTASRDIHAHVEDNAAAVTYGRSNTLACSSWPNMIAAIELTLSRKHASIIDPVQEHSTCASGSQNVSG